MVEMIIIEEVSSVSTSKRCAMTKQVEASGIADRMTRIANCCPSTPNR
jgi:hypothetical protein